MKTAEFKKHYDSLLADQRKQMEAHAKQRRELSKQIMVTRMVADNIKDIVPVGWGMEVSSWGAHITLVQPKDTPIDVMVKETTKLAKRLNIEPNKRISRGSIDITFYLFPSFETRHNWVTNVALCISSGNTESCEIEEVEEWQPVKKTVLTGYCKALAEQKYLSHAD